VKTYKVLLHPPQARFAKGDRDYIVNIHAKNEKKAMSLAEFFIAGDKDASTENEREQHSFRINEIEMVTNDAFEVEKKE